MAKSNHPFRAIIGFILILVLASVLLVILLKKMKVQTKFLGIAPRQILPFATVLSPL